VAGEYHGPHRVILNRNPVRRSIGGHFNRIAELSHGELVIAQASDDVSVPERTMEVYDAWERSGRKATSIHSDYVQIDATGRVVEKVFQNKSQYRAQAVVDQSLDPIAFVQTLQPSIFGCTEVYSRNLCRMFGPLPEALIHEDDVLALRSILGGGLTYINKPLVRYRVHGANVYARANGRTLDIKKLQMDEDRLRQNFKNRMIMYDAFQADLERAKQLGLRNDAELQKALEAARRLREQFRLKAEFLESGLFGKCRILTRLAQNRHANRDLVVRLLPRSLFIRMRWARAHVSRA